MLLIECTSTFQTKKSKTYLVTFFRCLKCQKIEKTMDWSIVKMTELNQLVIFSIEEIHIYFMQS